MSSGISLHRSSHIAYTDESILAPETFGEHDINKQYIYT